MVATVVELNLHEIGHLARRISNSCVVTIGGHYSIDNIIIERLTISRIV